MKFSISTFASILLLLSVLLAAQDDGITPEIIVGLNRVSAAEISPSAEMIAYVRRVPRAATEAVGSPYNELWVVPANDGTPRQYLGKPASVSSVSWSPDGKNICFIQTDKDINPYAQVYEMPVDGGAPRALTTHESSISSYKWAPDGSTLAFVAKDPLTAAEKAAKEKGGDWIIPDENFKQNRLWIRDVKTEVSHMLISDEQSVWSYEWAPDGKSILVQATETPGIDDSYMFKKIYVVNRTDGSQRLLCKTEGKLADMAISPNGKQVAFLSAVSLNDPIAQSVFLVPAAGGTARNLIDGFEGSVNSLQWMNEQSILLLSTEGCISTIRSLDVKNGAMKQIISGQPNIQQLSVHVKSGKFAAVADAPAHPAELFGGELKKASLNRITNSNAVLQDIRLAREEITEWEGADGMRIEGILTYPLNYDSNKKYPLILQIHGGPEGVSRYGWSTNPLYPVQLLAAKGYFVLQPNYRGSGGRGVAFSKADHNDLGGKEFEDVLKGIDMLTGRGMVDNSRVGTGGWSYGGYFSAWAATKYSERFKASMVGAGLTNWISFSNTTDIPNEMSLVHWNSWWYHEMDLFWDRSPMAHINNARTATLVVHGMEDKRVDREQGMQLYQALKLKGTDSKLILYPREPHGVNEIPHQLHYIETLMNWYKQYVMDADKPKTSKKYLN